MRFGDAPSDVAAITCKWHVSSRIATALQNNGNSWNYFIPSVANVANAKDNGLTTLLIRKTKTWVAILSTFCNVA